MQDLTFLLKLLVFVAIASLLLWLAGWFAIKRVSYWVAESGLRGEGGEYEAWRPWLAMPVVGLILATVALWGYVTIAPRATITAFSAPITESTESRQATSTPPASTSWFLPNATAAEGLWNSFIAFTLGALWWIGLIWVVGAAPLAAVLNALKQSQAIRRRQLLKDKKEAKNLDDVRAKQNREAAGARGRNIVICCDGTGNRPGPSEGSRRARIAVGAYTVLSNGGDASGQPLRDATNVYKLFCALKKNEAQAAWYDPGVGTDTSPDSRRVARVGRVAGGLAIRPLVRGAWVAASILRLLEAATGRGVYDNVIEAYTLLARTYRPGDRIYLIGFSRGAWTVRCLATVIACCGVLKPSCTRYAADVVHFVVNRRNPEDADPDDAVWMRDDVTDVSARVAFLGVFDMVAALGFPLWGWWFRLLTSPKIAWTKNPLKTLKICDKVYHAVSMDERRSQYFVTLFDEKEIKEMEGRIEQVWFRGDHSDVGGGRAETALSDITLRWMIDKARGEENELEFDDKAMASLLPGDPLGFIHDELEVRRRWRLFCSWPRWFPTPRKGISSAHGSLHQSVYERAEALHAKGRHDLVFLDWEQTVNFEVPANCEWYRSGIVLENGKTYRLTWLDGKWRDGAHRECGPAGEQSVSRWRRAFNRFFRMLRCPRLQMFRFPAVDENGGPDWDRHKPQEPRMMLIATHAHPRDWPPKEGGVRELRRLFFWRDPIQLVEQLAPIGINLGKAGGAVFLKVEEGVPDGMLWLFANDHWMAACDNSGAVRLEIKHVPAREADRPLWTLKKTKDGGPCEHAGLRRLNKQTADDQKKDRQRRAVWTRDPTCSVQAAIDEVRGRTAPPA